MSRIKGCFEQLKSTNTKALIPYIVAGDPNLDISLGLMHALVEAGANIIELGIPFSDPSSDGAVIQQAAERALSKNTSLKNVLELVTKFRSTNDETPVVLMGYLNPVETMGYQKFTDSAVAAGVDGLLIVDMPPEEADDLLAIVKATVLDVIFLVAPTTTVSRAKNICQTSSGYIYYISLKGVTGAAHLDIDSVKENIKKIRINTNLPIGVGFGIGDAQSAASIAKVADAIVVGSALVNKIAELKDTTEYSQQQLLNQVSLIKEMRVAMDMGAET